MNIVVRKRSNEQSQIKIPQKEGPVLVVVMSDALVLASVPLTVLISVPVLVLASVPVLVLPSVPLLVLTSVPVLVLASVPVLVLALAAGTHLASNPPKLDCTLTTQVPSWQGLPSAIVLYESVHSV